jgi:hypothetical protein
MQIIELPPPDLAARANQYVVRTDGLHLSNVTQDMLATMDPARYGTVGRDDAKWGNFLAGLIWERVLEIAWVDRETQIRPELIRPGEVTVDGVIGTPDAYDTAIGQPEEYKATKKSCRQPITDAKFWHYIVQLKAYAYMVGSTSGALWVWYVNGNYSRDDDDLESGYVTKGYQFHFTEIELWENWRMILRHANRRGWLDHRKLSPAGLKMVA